MILFMFWFFVQILYPFFKKNYFRVIKTHWTMYLQINLNIHTCWQLIYRKLTVLRSFYKFAPFIFQISIAILKFIQKISSHPCKFLLPFIHLSILKDFSSPKPWKNVPKSKNSKPWSWKKVPRAVSSVWKGSPKIN